jgi:hypothetical protein
MGLKSEKSTNPFAPNPTKEVIQRQRHRRDLRQLKGRREAKDRRRRSISGPPGWTGQLDTETSGGEDGGRRGRLGDLAMEAFKVDTRSYFQAKVPPGPSSSCRRGRPPVSPTRLGGCEICSFPCGSECHQSSPKAWAYRCPMTGDPQRHQVGTANGRARRSQSGDQDY